jgi:uncharacterized membrane protein YcaP (DUF421 family)
LEQALQAQRMTRDETLAAVRAQRTASLAAVAAVVLETDGSFTVISPLKQQRALALASVERPNDTPTR